MSMGRRSLPCTRGTPAARSTAALDGLVRGVDVSRERAADGLRPGADPARPRGRRPVSGPATGPKCDVRTTGARARIRSTLASASSTSTSGAGVQGDSTSAHGRCEPIASPVNIGARPVVVQGDVVRGVAGRVHGGQRAVTQIDPRRRRRRTQALGRHRDHRAVERAHPVLAIGARGARHQPVRIDEVPGADLVHPHGRARVPFEERADAPGMIHVDVRDHDVREVVRSHAEAIERRDDAVVSAPGPGLDQRGLRRLDEIHRVELAFPGHHRVDRGDLADRCAIRSPGSIRRSLSPDRDVGPSR